jgi:hypothetical protein
MHNFSDLCLQDDAKYLDHYNAERLNDGFTIIYLKVYGDRINKDNIDQYIDCLAGLGIKDFELEIISTSNENIDDFDILNKGLEDIRARLEAVQKEEDPTRFKIQ